MPIRSRRSGIDADVQQILDDFRRVVRSLRQASRAAEARSGITGAQLFVLRALTERPRMSLNMLAARTRTHQSSVSVVVKRLITRGLVRRRRSRDDARRLELELTARGRAVLADAPLAAQDDLIAGLEDLSASRRRALAGSLRALVRAMRLPDEAPSMFFEE